MSPTFLSALVDSLSARRLDAYRMPHDHDIDTLERYIWNVRLCEAIYPALHCLEITLRNHLDRHVAFCLGDSDWLVHALLVAPMQEEGAPGELTESEEPKEGWLGNAPGFFLDQHLEQIGKAGSDLKGNKKPIEQGRMVAELTFGFWTRFFLSHYEHRIWNKDLTVLLPHAQSQQRHRGSLEKRLNKIREIRNRVSHHEMIYTQRLGPVYDDIHTIIRLMCPEMSLLLDATDNFPYLLTRDCRRELREWLNEL